MAEHSRGHLSSSYGGSGHLKYPWQICCQGQVAHSAFCSSRRLNQVSTNVAEKRSGEVELEMPRILEPPSTPRCRNKDGSSSRIIQREPSPDPHMEANTEWKNSTGVSTMGSRR